jgi:UDP-N-acetylmuramyl pentapeptide phosphotransferase/UDP-N-acetylglucosamine-1-phosphate transferase
MGLLADTTDAGPISRLLGQALIGAGAGSLLGDWSTALIGAIAVPTVVNVVNFMDGIDGITGMTMSAWAAVALFSARVDGTLVLAALTLGGALGFLPWNVPRARMFLGDVGSYLFGGLVAMALLVEQSGGGRPVLVAAALTPYLLDVGLTLAWRSARGTRVLDAHREHLYQRLSRRRGWTHVRVAGLAASLTLAAGSMALLFVGQNGIL